MQLFGDLDILSFARINRLDWIGRVNELDSKRNVFEYLTKVFGEVY